MYIPIYDFEILLLSFNLNFLSYVLELYNFLNSGVIETVIKHNFLAAPLWNHTDFFKLVENLYENVM